MWSVGGLVLRLGRDKLQHRIATQIIEIARNSLETGNQPTAILMLQGLCLCSLFLLLVQTKPDSLDFHLAFHLCLAFFP